MALEEKALRIKESCLRLTEGLPGDEREEALCFVPALTALCCAVMKHRPDEADWPDRDRLILSESVPRAACEAALREAGLMPAAAETFPAADIPAEKDFSAAALALETALKARADMKIYRSFLVLSQRDCLKGQLWEKAIIAAENMLEDLTVILCRRAGHILPGTDNICAKFSAFGFDTLSLEGENPDAAALALLLPRRSHKPLFVCCQL